jgi:hypothetical protein
MKIPDRHDWGSLDECLDLKSAFKSFYQKSLAEAEIMFAQNALYYQEDLMWMPKIPFRFYLPAYINYLMSEESKGDSDAANGFLSLIDWKLDPESGEMDDLAPLWPDTLRVLHHIEERQRWYDAEVEIYGDFKASVSSLKKKAQPIASP